MAISVSRSGAVFQVKRARPLWVALPSWNPKRVGVPAVAWVGPGRKFDEGFRRGRGC